MLFESPSAIELDCTFPCSIKPFRGDVQNAEALSQNISPSPTTAVHRSAGENWMYKENEFRNKKKSFRI